MGHATFEGNLRALRAKYPEYADLVTGVAHPGAWDVHEHSGAVLCRAPDGRWVHGPDDPWPAALHDARLLAEQAPRLYVVVRPGLGYQALALVRELSTREPGSVVLIVEDRLELWRAGLHHLDWRETLRFRGTLLRLGNPYQVIENVMEMHPALGTLPVTLVAAVAEATSPACQALGGRLETLSGAFRSSTESKFAAAELLVAERCKRREPPRVLLAGQEVGYLAQPLRAGFAECDCEVVSWDFDRQKVPRDVLAQASLPALLDYLPDVVLWINQPELSSIAHVASRDLGIVNLLWSVDSPRRVGLSRSDYEVVDAHLSFDAGFLDPSARQRSQLSVAAGIRPMPDCRANVAAWPARLGPDVSFVGSYGEQRIAEMRLGLELENPERLQLLNELAAGEDDPAEAFEHATGAVYQRAACAYIDEVRTMRRRQAFLAAIPRESLRLFGSPEWGRAGDLADCYAGRTVHYGPDLASLYFHSKINVNVFHAQCVDSTNSRVYDVLASGGFLLTEYRPCLAREFEVDRHLVTFASPEELRDKVRFYLAHEKEREAIARAGQQHVLQHHTFSQRCRTLLGLASAL